MTKRCGHCKEDLPLSAFHHYARGKHQRQSWCKVCTSAHNKKYYIRNAARHKAVVCARRQKIRAWLNDQRKVCQFRVLDDGIEKRKHEFDTRPELDDCKPLGFATWWTHGAVRNIRMRNLTAEEAAEKPKAMEMDF